MQKYLISSITIIVLLSVFYGDIEIGGNKSGTSIIDSKTFVDDVGNLIKVDKPHTKIVSLFTEHTENLYYIGAGENIIAVDKDSIFPPDIINLPRYSIKSEFDSEQIIVSNPDLILISPEINRRNPGFVTKLEVAGLKVVSLRPNRFNEFDIYIKKLGMLTGKQDKVKSLLSKFHSELEKINLIASSVENQTRVFMESSEKGYLTPSISSLPYLAIEFANGINIANSSISLNPYEDRTTFGKELILKEAQNIDVYVTLIGGTDAGTSKISIKQKQEFMEIKAIRENRLFEIENTIIDSYTFRYLLGVKEIARILYPEKIDNLDEFNNDNKLNRESFSKIVIKYFHIPIYINSNNAHYDFKRYNHVYGDFRDVNWKHEDFNYIETIVMKRYLSDFDNKEDIKYFIREKNVTMSDIAKFIYILYDIQSNGVGIKINDIETDKNKVIIQKVVDNNLIKIEDGNFYPNKVYTNKEFINFLESLKYEYNDQNY